MPTPVSRDREHDERLLGAVLEAGARARDRAGLDRERAAVGHRLHRVEQEVDHHLLEAVGVAGDARQALGAVEARLDLRARELTGRAAPSSSATSSLRLTSALPVVPTLRRVKSSRRWMMRVMRAVCSAMISAFFSTASGSLRLLLDRARAAGDHVERRADLVRDLGGELTDRRELLGLAEALLERELGFVLALRLAARLAQRERHLVEARRDLADLVVALGQDDVREVALGDVVDAAQQLRDRPADQAAGERSRRRSWSRARSDRRGSRRAPCRPSWSPARPRVS